MRLCVLVLVGGWLSGCVAHHRFECEKHGGAPVVRVDSEHFSVTSDLLPADVRFEVRRMERLWDAFFIFFKRAPAPGERLQVVLSHDEVPEEFLPGSGGFVTQGLTPLMVTTVTRGRQAQSTNAHELVHVVSRHWLPNQPRWIAEGLAQFLGDAVFTSEYSLHFGGWRWTEGLVEPLVTLWGWDAVRGTPEEDREHYQSAWAWLHYLASRDAARLDKLWTALSSGKPPRDAFQSVFPLSEHAELQQRVQRYVDEGRYSEWEVKLLQDHAISEPVAVSPWELHLLRRDLAQATGWTARAKAESARARELAPSPEPYEVSLAVALDTLQGPARTNRIAALLDPGSARPSVLIELGLAVDAPPFSQLDSFRSATTLLPSSARAHLGLARVALRVGDPGALAAAQRAVSLAPWSVEARLLEAQALASLARCEDAWRSIAAARGLSVESAQIEAPQVESVRNKLLPSCPEAK